jgi:molecular chaperone GrpE
MTSEPPKPKPKRQKAEERIVELELQLTDTGKSLETMTTQLKYAKADLDNLQKQTQRRIEEAVDRNNARILSQLITIADELRIVAATTKNDADAMIYIKLLKLLENEGVKPIEANGKPFDPYKHEAILEVETPECPPGCVAEEIRSGYTYKDKVLRAAMVKVAKAPSTKTEEKHDV